MTKKQTPEKILEKHLDQRLYELIHNGYLDSILKAMEEYKNQENNLKLPDIYNGEINAIRIKEYTTLHQEYNSELSTIRDVFCKGADWYKKNHYFIGSIEM